MSIKIVNLTEENLVDAPEWEKHPFSCKYYLCSPYYFRFILQATAEPLQITQAKLL